MMKMLFSKMKLGLMRKEPISLLEGKLFEIGFKRGNSNVLTTKLLKLIRSYPRKGKEMMAKNLNRMMIVEKKARIVMDKIIHLRDTKYDLIIRIKSYYC